MSKIIRRMMKSKDGTESPEEIEREDGTKSPPGLWDAIRNKQARGETMRKPGDPGAPTDKAIKDSQ